VRDKLPERLRTVAERRMRQAYHASSAVEAEGLLTELARELDKTHPGAAASLREGMAETLTIVRLGVPPTLARTLRSTNPIESMIEICREHAKNVKRWRDGTMALRWCAAGMLEADHQFRRVNGRLHLPKPRAALEAGVRQKCRGQRVFAGHDLVLVVHVAARQKHAGQRGAGRSRRSGAARLDTASQPDRHHLSCLVAELILVTYKSDAHPLEG
jgi:hypothetical protein